MMYTCATPNGVRSMDADRGARTCLEKVKPDEIKLAKQVIENFEGELEPGGVQRRDAGGAAADHRRQDRRRRGFCAQRWRLQPWRSLWLPAHQRQGPGRRQPGFEVASVKPSQPGRTQVTVSWQGGVTMISVPLRAIVQFAWRPTPASSSVTGLDQHRAVRHSGEAARRDEQRRADAADAAGAARRALQDDGKDRRRGSFRATHSSRQGPMVRLDRI